MPNVSAQLIENFDWRIGFMVFGFFTLCVVVPFSSAVSDLAARRCGYAS